MDGTNGPDSEARRKPAAEAQAAADLIEKNYEHVAVLTTVLFKALARVGPGALIGLTPQ